MRGEFSVSFGAMTLRLSSHAFIIGSDHQVTAETWAGVAGSGVPVAFLHWLP